MSEELARVVNETRLGRDLADALAVTAQRMQSDDFEWVAQAIAINAETGGNLAEVLDQVGRTIRERNQIRRQVTALSAEGRLSAHRPRRPADRGLPLPLDHPAELLRSVLPEHHRDHRADRRGDPAHRRLDLDGRRREGEVLTWPVTIDHRHRRRRPDRARRSASFVFLLFPVRKPERRGRRVDADAGRAAVHRRGHAIAHLDRSRAAPEGLHRHGSRGRSSSRDGRRAGPSRAIVTWQDPPRRSARRRSGCSSSRWADPQPLKVIARCRRHAARSSSSPTCSSTAGRTNARRRSSARCPTRSTR